MIDEYIKHKKNMDEQIFKKLNIKVAKNKHNQLLQHLKEQIQQILEKGLDIGTIIKYMVKVEIVKYQSDFYFKDLKTGILYRINDYI